jgi:hypothetical protein
MRRLDRALGIGLGILLGIGIVVIFVFFGSEGTIDAPRINQGSTTTRHHSQKPQHHSRQRGSSKPSPEPSPADVPISGGAPPSSGPAHLDYKQGERVRLRVNSDTTVELELLGYGLTTTAEGGRTSQITFTATKTGNFPLIVSASHIAVAQIRVDPR